MSETSSEGDPEAVYAVCILCFGIASTVGLSVTLASVLNTQNSCGAVQDDFIYLGATCNITRFSHTAIEEEYELCKDGSELIDGGVMVSLIVSMETT